MESTVPGNSQGVGTVPAKVVFNRGSRGPGSCNMMAFMTLLAGLVLAIIAIVKNDLTKVTFYGPSTQFTEYCGWNNIHSYDDQSVYNGSPYSFTYSHHCHSDDRACTLERVGKAFYSLLIVGIAFAGFALITFLADTSSIATFLFILICEFLFFACMLADALIWGLFKSCEHYCHNLSFPNLPSSITSCHSKLGTSWILVVIAGGLALLSIKLLTWARCLCHKRY